MRIADRQDLIEPNTIERIDLPRHSFELTPTYTRPPAGSHFRDGPSLQQTIISRAMRGRRAEDVFPITKATRLELGTSGRLYGAYLLVHCHQLHVTPPSRVRDGTSNVPISRITPHLESSRRVQFRLSFHAQYRDLDRGRCIFPTGALHGQINVVRVLIKSA